MKLTFVLAETSTYGVTPFKENGIRSQAKLSSCETVATVSPFRTSRPTCRNSALTGSDAETQRLRRELQIEQEKVQRLSAQLSTNVRAL